MEKLKKIDAFLNRLMMIIAALAIVALMLLTTANVVLRIVHVPYSGTYELAGFLGAVVVAFALGYTQKRKDHIMVDIVTRKFPPGIVRIIDSIAYLVCAIFFGIVTVQVFAWGMIIYHTGEVSETLKIIYYPFVWCVALGFAVLTFTLLIDFIFAVTKTERT